MNCIGGSCLSGHLIIIVDDSCNQNILNVGPGLSLTLHKRDSAQSRGDWLNRPILTKWNEHKKEAGEWTKQMTGAISEIVTTRAQLIFSLTSILSVESSGNTLGGGFDEIKQLSVKKSVLTFILKPSMELVHCHRIERSNFNFKEISIFYQWNIDTNNIQLTKTRP